MARGAEVIKKKGGAGFAVGIAIQEVIESIALDRRRDPAGFELQEGCYGIRNVALSRADRGRRAPASLIDSRSSCGRKKFKPA